MWARVRQKSNESTPCVLQNVGFCVAADGDPTSFFTRWIEEVAYNYLSVTQAQRWDSQHLKRSSADNQSKTMGHKKNISHALILGWHSFWWLFGQEWVTPTGQARHIKLFCTVCFKILSLKCTKDNRKGYSISVLQFSLKIQTGLAGQVNISVTITIFQT